MNCQYCSNEIPENSTSCPNCGAGSSPDTQTIQPLPQYQPHEQNPFGPPPLLSNPTPGKGFLIASGVIFLIFGILGLCGLPFTFMSTDVEINVASTLLSVVQSVAYTLVGIFALMWSSKPEKAKLLTWVGLGMLALSIIGFIAGIIGISEAMTEASEILADANVQFDADSLVAITIATLICMLPITALPYIFLFIGARKNNKSSRNTNQDNFM